MRESCFFQDGIEIMTLLNFVFFVHFVVKNTLTSFSFCVLVASKNICLLIQVVSFRDVLE